MELGPLKYVQNHMAHLLLTLLLHYVPPSPFMYANDFMQVGLVVTGYEGKPTHSGIDLLGGAVGAGVLSMAATL